MPDVKLIRKQIKNVLDEQGKALFTNEIYDAAFKQLQAEIKSRLDSIESHIKDVLGQLDARQKDMQSFLVREALKGNPPVEQDNPPVVEDKKPE